MTRVLHDGRRFRIEGHRGEAGFRDLLKWQMSGKRAPWPSRVENRSHPPPPARVHGKDLMATWIGHSTVLLQTASLNILTDPFLSERASPLSFAGPKRVRPPALTAKTLPPIDIILVSHNHYDHMDLAALREIARHHAPHVVTPHGNARWIRPAGKNFRVDELHWGQSLESGALRIHLTPALHWSKRGLFDANTALWGAFLVETPGGPVYFAGDTGFGEGATFHHIRETFGPPRLSLLPIGAYEPRWFMQPQHMNPAEAVNAHMALESTTSLAIHHGTIQLTDETIDAPARALGEALSERSIDPARFLVPEAGEVVTIA
ncbi:MBL fold metallo-hydrolase [Aestuariivirga sp.]|uniref:MBL fold metallo-hydrolase n=1 Tax=Aestuariivirga sp. TaxID=2650926 RepID=UPI00359333AF